MNLQDEIIKWNAAVKAETARLIASGYSSREAKIRAVDNVKHDREQRAMDDERKGECGTK